MAEKQSMTIEQVAREVMAGEHADVLRESVRLVVQELMNAEVSELIGAARGERNPEGRLTQRNGYRRREWDTRVGVIDLEIPKLRQGSYFPHGLLEPRKRGEQALLSVVRQAYVCGVSTRRVDQLRGRDARAADLQERGFQGVRALGRAGGGVPLPPAGGRLPVSVA